MIDADTEAFGKALFVLGEAFNEPISDTKIEAYFSALREFDVEAVLAAMRHALHSSRFFPRPVDLRESITGTTEDAAEQAWGAVLREIRRVGYYGVPALEERTLRAVRELWGGWGRLCETLPNEGPELVGWIKQFKATYASVERTKQRQLTMGTLHPDVRRFIDADRRQLAERTIP